MAELVRLSDVAMATLRLREGRARGLPPLGASAMTGPDRIVAIGPDEWLAIANDGDGDALCARLAGFGGVVIDTSGNRTLHRVAGPDARWLLSAGCSFDLDKLQPGDAICTLLSRAQVIIIAETRESWLMLPRRSFAPYLETWGAAVGRV